MRYGLIAVLALIVGLSLILGPNNTANAQVSVQQAIDYWEQCKGIFGYDICKGMVGIGEQIHIFPARSAEGVDYWEQCKNSFGIDTCKGIAAVGEWLGLIRAP